MLRKRCGVLALSQLLLAAAFLVAPGAWAQDEDEEEEETQQTATMRQQVYELLLEAEICVEMEDLQCARDQLDRVQGIRDLNSYELAQMWAFFARIYLIEENYPEAINAFERVLEQPELPFGLATDSMYALAQLYVFEERFEEGLEMLDQWFLYAENPGPAPYYFKAIVHYQLQQYEEGIPAVLSAVDVATQRDQEPEERWYQLLNVFYWELENYPKSIETLTILANRWPSRDYIVQLAGMYGQQQDEAKMLALYETAYEANWLASSTEFVTLAQMYLQAEVPYKAASLLQDGLDQGIIEESESAWRLLSQAWQLAQEDTRALPALTEAAALSDDGELDYRLAQSYRNLARWEDCIASSRTAIERGGLERPHEAALLLGSCLVELRRWDEARTVFQRLVRDARGERAEGDAREWVEWIAGEVARENELEAAKLEAAGG